MKFLIVSQYFQPEIGATQTRLRSMAAELAALGVEVDVITALPSYPVGRILRGYRWKLWMHERFDSIKILRLPIFPATGKGMLRLLNYLSFCLFAGLVLPFKSRRDIIFVESPPLFLAPVVLALGKFFGAKIVVNVADLWPDSAVEFADYKEGLAVRLARHLESWIYSKADIVNGVTIGICKKLEERLPPNQGKEKVTFYPNGVDTNAVRPVVPDASLRVKLGIPEDANLLLYLGTIGYAHGLDEVLPAIKSLEGDNVWLLVVGSGSEVETLRQRVIELGINNVVHHEPIPIHRVSELYAIADFGLSTLRDKPLFSATRPVKVLSNMACGKPVIYVGKGEGAELVRQADAGVTVSPGDNDSLASAIRGLIRDPSLARAYGQKGREYVCKYLDWRPLTKQWLFDINGILAD